jgi:hypothetical protein
MQKIREFGFPVVLIVAWIMAAAYTLSLMIEPSGRSAHAPETRPAAEASASPAS